MQKQNSFLKRRFNFFFLRLGFSVWLWLSWNWLCRPCCLELTEIFLLLPPRCFIKGVHRHCPVKKTQSLITYMDTPVCASVHVGVRRQCWISGNWDHNLIWAVGTERGSSVRASDTLTTEPFLQPPLLVHSFAYACLLKVFILKAENRAQLVQRLPSMYKAMGSIPRKRNISN